MTRPITTTTRATDSTYGHQIKSGAATRSLVGMLRTNGSTQFYSSAAELGVISYYNRRSRAVTTTVTGSGSSSTTMVSAISQNIICWGGEGAIHQVTGNAFNSTAGAFCITYATYDGASLGQTTIAKSVVANDRTPVSTGYAISPTEGFHTFGAGIAVNTGSGGWDITVSTLVRN